MLRARLAPFLLCGALAVLVSAVLRGGLDGGSLLAGAVGIAGALVVIEAVRRVAHRRTRRAVR